MLEKDPSLGRKTLWKIDLVIATSMFFISFFTFLDKNALGFTAIYGLKTDNHLVGNQYSTLASIFYYGYLLGQFIGFFIIPKFPVATLISVVFFLWGGLLMCFAACHSFGSLCAIRFLLGVLEAVIMPSFLMMVSVWWNRKEQPLRVAIFNNSLAGILNGVFSHSIAKMNASLATWKLIFIIYGASTVFYSFILMFILPNQINEAWFLTKEEKKNCPCQGYQ